MSSNQSETPSEGLDPECTDCGGTGEAYQTEKRCACQPVGSDTAGLLSDRSGLDALLWEIHEFIDAERLPDPDNAHPNDRDRFRDRNEEHPALLAKIRSAREAIAALSRAPEAEPYQDIEPGEHQEVLDAIAAHNSGEE